MSDIEFFNDPEAPVQPDQFAIEFSELLEQYRREKPRTVVEIGTREGGSLYQWMKHAKPGTTIISVDQPGAGRWGTRRQINYADWHLWAYIYNQDFFSILGNSHHKEVIDRVDEIVENGIDWLFIDGDHSLVGIIQDLTNYLPMMNNGGTIVIHDVMYDPSDEAIQIYCLIQLLQELLDVGIIYSHGGQTSRGLAVIKYNG